MLYIGKELLSVPPSPRSGMPPDWPAILAIHARDARHAALRSYYQAGVPAPDTPISNVPLLAMDFETTGLNTRRDDIVSIGLIPMSLARIQLRESRHWILNPRADLCKESVVIHGITHSTIANAPDLNEVLIKLLAMMAGNVMVVHHKGIEQRFLDAAFKKRIGEGIVFPCVDTLTLEAHLTRGQPCSGLLQKFWRRPPRVSLRLPESRARYHLPHYPAHNALTDALGCAELLQAQVAHHFSPDTYVKELWC
ncbi:3'-5' exonuclease [Pectobacteriaceae bacterium CE90]|nr:3'-5' exonuclease [Pectobacteriaceae bacterium CE90]